jgi:hypothetical protein
MRDVSTSLDMTRISYNTGITVLTNSSHVDLGLGLG